MKAYGQQRGGDGKEHGIANDANVADLHVAQRNAQEPGKSEHRADEQEYANCARETSALHCGRREQRAEWKEDVPCQYVESVDERRPPEREHQVAPGSAKGWMTAQHQDREVNQTGEDGAKAKKHDP